MDITESALEIVRTLRRAGYEAYYAGGWVRDRLLQHPSDDIDIATNASPEAIIELFPHTHPVGLAFGVVIVVMHGHQFEVASFRQDMNYIDGRRPETIVLSSAFEDAQRRDFTINGIFYDPLNDLVLDHVEGVKDLHQGIIRTIGNPRERFFEDKLRMIRAIRFAARFGFKIDPETEKAIQTYCQELLPAVAMERIWQEFNKMAKSPRFDWALLEMHRLGLLSVIFPALSEISQEQIQQRVAVFSRFPKNTPTILYLMELFPDAPQDELFELSQYLRTSAHESNLIAFAYKGKELLEKEKIASEKIPEADWANFYADRLFRICFEAIAATYPEEEHREIIQRHKARHERLLPHVQRIAERKPVVTAAILKEYGIHPGKEMGRLLKEAERLAITHDLHHPTDVIVLLKNSGLWPKENTK